MENSEPAREVHAIWLRKARRELSLARNGSILSWGIPGYLLSGFSQPWLRIAGRFPMTQSAIYMIVACFGPGHAARGRGLQFQAPQRLISSKVIVRRMKAKKIALWVAICATAATVAVVVLLRFTHWRPRMVILQGAVVRRSADPHKELPIAGAAVTVSDSTASVTAVSGDTGYFTVKFPERIWPREVVNLAFRHPDYQPLDEKLLIGIHATGENQLYVARMTSTVALPPPAQVAHPTAIKDIRIRYTFNNRRDTDVGSFVRVFEVVNQGNVPCAQNELCSPDGRWKAAKDSITLDAGTGNVFRNVRASCIAGPCPFTRIDSGALAGGGQKMVVSAVAWSDTATFLVEAEVYQESIVSDLRLAYPVIYGGDLHFTAPPTAEGVTIEADVGGTPTVFPLGPGLYLNWGICNSRKGPSNDTIYQCELRPGYTF